MSTIDKLPPLPRITNAVPQINLEKNAPAASNGFADTLQKFVSGVNEMQKTAGDKTLKFATGEITDLHEVMAASEEASVSLMLLLELRNKALDAYKELMRTPV
jgi:flagellar hook-basal body complex protein FliE